MHVAKIFHFILVNVTHAETGHIQGAELRGSLEGAVIVS